MKIKKIAHVALAVADMEQTLSKLEQVLGIAAKALADSGAGCKMA